MSSTLYGLARIGRDAELRHTAQGEPVASLSLAFNYGRRGSDGKQPTVWVDGALWGKRAEALAGHLLKGTSVVVTLNDVHIETFEGKNGTASKMVGRVADIEFAGAPVARPAPPPPPPNPAPKTAGSGFDDMDDDIPFITASAYYDMTTSKQRRLKHHVF